MQYPEYPEDFPELVSDLKHPSLPPSLQQLRSVFARGSGAGTPAVAQMRNPHHEPDVDAEAAARATPAAVLIAIVDRPDPTILLTKRHEGISFPGHIVFPGGRCDEADRDPVETALREAREEVGLEPTEVEVLGRLGDYASHSGFRIAPVVAIARPPLALVPHPAEVEAIFELPLALALDSASYRLRRGTKFKERAFFFLEHEGHVVAGSTVSLLIGLYELLVRARTSPR